MRDKNIAAALASAVFFASLLPAVPAMALTITNKSSKEHTIGVDMGNKEEVHKIAGGGSVTLKEQCAEGCGLTGPWGYSWMAKTGQDFAFDDTKLIPGAGGGRS